jgi:hypothetical protein
VKGNMRGGGYEGGDHSTGDYYFFWGFSWIAERRVEFCSRKISTGTGLLEVLGTGARISI